MRINTLKKVKKNKNKIYQTNYEKKIIFKVNYRLFKIYMNRPIIERRSLLIFIF